MCVFLCCPFLSVLVSRSLNPLLHLLSSLPFSVSSVFCCHCFWFVCLVICFFDKDIFCSNVSDFVFSCVCGCSFIIPCELFVLLVPSLFYYPSFFLEKIFIFIFLFLSFHFVPFFQFLFLCLWIFISSVFFTSFLSLLIFGCHFCLFKHFFDKDIFCWNVSVLYPCLCPVYFWWVCFLVL